MSSPRWIDSTRFQLYSPDVVYTMLHYFYLRKTHIKHLFPPLKSQKKKVPFRMKSISRLLGHSTKKAFLLFLLGWKRIHFSAESPANSVPSWQISTLPPSSACIIKSNANFWLLLTMERAPPRSISIFQQLYTCAGGPAAVKAVDS